MFNKIKSFWDWLDWVSVGSPVVRYKGYNCGCCGAWVDKNFSIPTYKSAGEGFDTWGLCPSCSLLPKNRLSVDTDTKISKIKLFFHQLTIGLLDEDQFRCAAVRCSVKNCTHNDDENGCKCRAIEIEPMGVMMRWNGTRTDHGRCKMFETKTYQEGAQ